jgi:hypothetical protein
MLTITFNKTTVSAENQSVVIARLERHHFYEASAFEDLVPNVLLNGFSHRSYYIRPLQVAEVTGAVIEMVTPYPNTQENFPSIDWYPDANFTVEDLDDSFRYEWAFLSSIPDAKQAAVWIHQTNFPIEFQPQFACQRIWNPLITSESVTQTLTIEFTPSIAGGVHVHAKAESTPVASVTIVQESNSSSPSLREFWLESENGRDVSANWGGDCEIGKYTFSIDITVVNELFPEPILYKPSVGIGLGYGPPESPVTSDHVTVWDDIDGDDEDESSITYSGSGSYDWQVIIREEYGVELQSYSASAELESTSITCSVSPQETKQDESITVSGSITPAVEDVNVTLVYKKPDGTTFERNIKTASDGSFSDLYKASEIGSWTVEASWAGNQQYMGASSSQVSFSVGTKGPCLIATATYGSELSQELQFLRGFRDNLVLNTVAGRSFMTAFNRFYYSFSPSVASSISNNEALRGAMKIILYPLIGILHLSSLIFSLFSFNVEFGVVMAGLVASSLIAFIYIMPWTLLFSLFKKYKCSSKIIRLLTLIWIGSFFAIILGELTLSSPLMMISTGAFVLTTMSLTTLLVVSEILSLHN